MRSVMRRPVLAAAVACALSMGALVGTAPASAATCSAGNYSLKDNGQNAGVGGYYLTVTGHNQVVETTGTGGCWQFFAAATGNYFIIEDLETNLCLNAVGYSIYADSCHLTDVYEEWWDKTEPNGSEVFQNVAYSENLTATGLFNNAAVELSGGPASPENLWWQTLIN